MKKIIILGAGGNSKVIIETILLRKEILQENIEIVGILDDDIHKHSLCGYRVLGKISDIKKYRKRDGVFFVNGIGSNVIRKKVFNQFIDVDWYTVIHPNSIISKTVGIGTGTVIMAGVIINADSKIGNQCIINTGAIVEHENIIEDFVHLASGVTTAGSVRVGEETMLGTGAKVIQGVQIGNKTIIGAGAVVISDMPSNCTAVGVPAKVIKR